MNLDATSNPIKQPPTNFVTPFNFNTHIEWKENKAGNMKPKENPPFYINTTY